MRDWLTAVEAMPGKRKTSNVWEHFTLKSNKLAVCNYCKLEMSYCSSTGSLLKRIKTKHLFVDLTRSSSSDSCPSEPAEKQQKLTSYVRTSVTPACSKKITELILNTAVGDLRPISIVEAENLKKLINKLAPNYDIPSRCTFTRMIDEKFLICKVEMQKLLTYAKYAAITTDLWCSVKMQSFIGVTIHCVNKDRKLVNFVLASKEVNEVQSGMHIAEWLEAIIDDYKMSLYKIAAIVTDNGANIVNACEKLKEKYGWIHVRCAVHTLQLCFKQVFEIPQVKSAIGK